ncbi:MAG: hypothetical protein ACJ8AW_35390 [Rhodopila sp.]
MTASWGSMLRTIRAAVVVALLGESALAVPEQTRDMLAFLQDGGIWPPLSFQLTLLLLGVSAWFWSRAALAARFGIDDRQRQGSANPGFDWTAYTWLPRIVLGMTFAAGVAIAWRSGGSWWTIGGVVGFGIVTVLLATFRVKLLAIFRPQSPAAGPPPAPRSRFRFWWHGGWKARLAALLERAPGGMIPALVLLGLGLVLLALGMLEAFTSILRLPNLLAAVFPGPTCVLLLLALSIGPLVATTFVADGLTWHWRFGSSRVGFRRPPLLTVLALYVFVLVPMISHVHTVRITDTAPQRLSLPDLFHQWTEACAAGTGPVQPVIVAVSGGATRAGLWGAAVLDKVLAAQGEGGPALFAVSSVSGGSLGMAGAMTLLSQEAKPCRATGLAALRPGGDVAPLAGDALGPLLGGWLVTDIPRAFAQPAAWAVRSLTGHRPNGGDSAEAIEHAFENLWQKVRAKHAPKAPGWDAPFLSLFYRPGTTEYHGGMPLWVANGTDATTGNRVLTTPFAPLPGDIKHDAGPSPGWPFRGARDLQGLMRSDVPISTAINNTARFPYLEPFGEMLPADGKETAGSLVDGGYFENEGLQTALELAEWLTRQGADGRAVQPIIVQATGDGEPKVSTKDIMTCARASDAPDIGSQAPALQILAPLVGLYHVRGGHSTVLLREAHDGFCAPGIRFVHFYLPAMDGVAVPLNWVLSRAVAGFIWNEAFAGSPVNNADQLELLCDALAGPGGQRGPGCPVPKAAGDGAAARP